MPFSVPRILIIDDKEKDAIKIAKSIWKSKYAVRYIKYDPGTFLSQGKENIKGVRIVLMDIDLIGDGVFGSGSKNFSAVQQAIEYSLDEKNGPYVLITWSTFDAHAEELFEYLRERMSVKLRPVLCKRLNKEDYTSRNSGSQLSEKIIEYMHALEATGCLIEWERCILYATCATVFELMNIIPSSDAMKTNDYLKNVLYSLAEAEAEQHLQASNALRHLYSILSQLLYDEVARALPRDETILGEVIYSGKGVKPDTSWHQKINAMLHLDYADALLDMGHMPGDVFVYPAKGHGLPIPDEDTDSLIRGRFMDFKDKEKAACKDKIKAKCQLLLIEITPQCDYAQNKFAWHRYVVGALIPTRLIFLTYVLNRKANKRKNNTAPDFRWSSPEFQKGSDPPFRIIFNSRLIVSIPPRKVFLGKLGKRLFRIRQPLLNDMMSWLARQSSRPGHVSLSSLT